MTLFVVEKKSVFYIHEYLYGVFFNFIIIYASANGHNASLSLELWRDLLHFRW